MIEIRRVRREEFPEAVRLADEVFRGDGGRSMGLTYPTVFSPEYGQSFGAFEEGRMVAFIGLVPNVVRIGPAALRTYSVGGVCTDERYRGRGIAASILDRILEHLSDARVPLLLVSGGRSLYTRIGCREFGAMYRFELSESDAAALAPASGADMTIRPMSTADWFGLRDAALAKEVRYEQSLWDLATLLDAQVPASNSGLMNRILVAERPGSGDILGFFVYGGSPEGASPRDLVAVEWAGDAETVAALLAEAVRREGGVKLTARVASHEAELLERLSGIPSDRRHNEGTALITDPARFVEQVRPYLEEKDKAVANRLTVERTAGGARIAREGEGEAAELDTERFMKLVFEGEVPSDVPHAIAEDLNRLFPIPFPYTAGINFV